jgi:hypothetical protein
VRGQVSQLYKAAGKIAGHTLKNENRSIFLDKNDQSPLKKKQLHNKNDPVFRRFFRPFLKFRLL